MENLGSLIPEVKVLPADEFHTILYMMNLLQTGKTFAVIKMSYFAIKYFHSIVRYQNPCPASLPNNLLEGIKRILTYFVTNKSPVTVSQLYKMYNCFGNKTVSFSNLNNFNLYFIFHGFSLV